MDISFSLSLGLPRAYAMTLSAALRVPTSETHLASVSKKPRSSLVRSTDPRLRYAFSINCNDSFLHVLPALSSSPYCTKSWTTWDVGKIRSSESKMGSRRELNLESPSYISAYVLFEADFD